jgi:hypothetical protein
MLDTMAVVLAALEIPVWGVISLTLLVAWPMPADAPPQVTGASFLLTLLNLAAILALVSRRRVYGAWLLAMVQILDIVALAALRAIHGPFDDLASNLFLTVTVASLAAVILLILAPLARLTIKATEH